MEVKFFQMLSHCTYLWEAISTCKEFQLRGLPLSWECARETELYLTYKDNEFHYSFLRN